MRGGKQAYTEYRGAAQIREGLANRLGNFTGCPVSAVSELILTPGTQGALFLALGATVTNGTKVGVVEPDYFANRKLVSFFGGEVVPISLRYQGTPSENGPDLNQIEAAFKSGTKVFVFSTPNNPTGLIFAKRSIEAISALAAAHDVTLIVDQLYSRLLYSGEVLHISAHVKLCRKILSRSWGHRRRSLSVVSGLVLHSGHQKSLIEWHGFKPSFLYEQQATIKQFLIRGFRNL